MTRGREPAEPAGGAGARTPWLRRIVGWTVAALLVVAGAVFLASRRELLLETVRPDPAMVAAAVLCEVVLLLLRARVTRVLAQGLGAELGRVEAAGLASWTSVANYLMPFVGGAGLRAAYLKRRHGLPVTAAAALLAATWVVHFLLVGVAGIVGVLAAGGLDPGAAAPLLTLFGGVSAACLLVVLWPLPPPRGETRLLRAAGRVVAGWRRLRESTLVPVAVTLAALVVVNALALALYFRATGVPLEPAAALVVGAASDLSVVVSVTPAALGITEGAVVLAGRLLGVDPAVALIAAAIRRIVTVALALVVGALTVHIVPGLRER